MYNNTQEDFNKIFEVVNNFPEGTHKRNWNDISAKLNKLFNTSFNAKQWKARYDAAVKRINKHGSPLLRITPIKKEIVKNNKPELSTSEKKKKLLDYISRPRTIEQINLYLGIDEIEAYGLIQSLKIDNYIINYNTLDNTFGLQKNPLRDSRIYNHNVGDVTEFEFLVVSDNHWCTKHQQKSFVDYIYAEAHRRGIKNVYHVGDIVDGYYKNRPEQIYDLIRVGADEQKDYVVENWPKYPGMTTYLIIGNHDETHIRNGGFNIGKAIAQERDDFVYLGIGHAKIMLTPNCRMDLLHPLDGSSYAVSYSGQKYMDAISGGDKPNILFVGHHHKAMYFLYRNIHYFEAPSMTKQSSWMKRKRLANESGAWFIKVKVDSEGTIVSLIPEYIKQYKFLEDDY